MMNQPQKSAFSPARRRFLRGDPGGNRESLLPPWSGNPVEFHARCTGCGDCVTVCPEHILVRNAQGFPGVDFSAGGCSFCGQCVSACQPQALTQSADRPAWNLLAAISAGCLARKQVVCRTCGERCEAGAIAFRPQAGGISVPQLDDDLCTGCGFCVMDCPTRAISIQPRELA